MGRVILEVFPLDDPFHVPIVLFLVDNKLLNAFSPKDFLAGFPNIFRYGVLEETLDQGPCAAFLSQIHVVISFPRPRGSHAVDVCRASISQYRLTL